MSSKTLSLVVASAAIVVASSSTASGAATNTWTSTGTTTWTKKTNNPNIENCTVGLKCTKFDGSVSEPSAMVIGTEAPAGWTLHGVFVLNPQGNLLVVGGTTILAEEVPCPPGGCEVDGVHPAPPGGVWHQFKTNDVPSVNGSGSFDFCVVVEYDTNGDDPVGKTVSTWLSDDGHARYGDTTNEFFMQGPFSFTAPMLGAWGAALAALLLVIVGSGFVIRNRRAALA
jgi:hypothetical protein